MTTGDQLRGKVLKDVRCIPRTRQQQYRWAESSPIKNVYLNAISEINQSRLWWLIYRSRTH